MKAITGALLVLLALGAVADASARQLHVTRPSKPSRPSKPAMKPATSSSTTSTTAAVGGSGSENNSTAVMPATPAPTDIKLAQETVTSLASALLVQAAASPPPAFPAFVAIPLNDTAKMTPAGGSGGSASAGSSSSSNDMPEPPPPRLL